jgi:hypothetical protein
MLRLEMRKTPTLILTNLVLPACIRLLIDLGPAGRLQWLSETAFIPELGLYV